MLGDLLYFLFYFFSLTDVRNKIKFISQGALREVELVNPLGKDYLWSLSIGSSSCLPVKYLPPLIPCPISLPSFSVMLSLPGENNNTNTNIVSVRKQNAHGMVIQSTILYKKGVLLVFL